MPSTEALLTKLTKEHVNTCANPKCNMKFVYYAVLSFEERRTEIMTPQYNASYCPYCGTNLNKGKP